MSMRRRLRRPVLRIQTQVCRCSGETVPIVRALVVTNMYPNPERPALGSFVRDQVEALQRRGDVEVELFVVPAKGYIRALPALRRRFAGRRFDIVHAHFGLTAWPAVLARLGPVVVTL